MGAGGTMGAEAWVGRGQDQSKVTWQQWVWDCLQPPPGSRPQPICLRSWDLWAFTGSSLWRGLSDLLVSHLALAAVGGDGRGPCPMASHCPQ